VVGWRWRARGAGWSVQKSLEAKTARDKRAISDPGLAQSGRAGVRARKGLVRVAQAAGGADVCGFARTYVSSDDSLDEPSPGLG
jgi:hypothetical protein